MHHSILTYCVLCIWTSNIVTLPNFLQRGDFKEQYILKIMFSLIQSRFHAYCQYDFFVSTIVPQSLADHYRAFQTDQWGRKNKVLNISDGCCTEFNICYFILHLFQVINNSIFNLIMLIESGILLKNHVLVVIYAKILHYSFILTIYENFKSLFFFYLSSGHENLETCIQVWFE